MSIDNIFKCCKKNNILTGFTGLVLGAYGSYYVMGNYFGAPMNPDIKEPPAPAPDQPNNIQPPIEVPLGQPVTYRDLFYKNKGLVVLGGGLAILSIGSYIVYTSANIFSTKNQIDYLRDQINLKSGDINQLQEQINLKSGNIQQLQEKLDIMQSNEQFQRGQLEQARRENELLKIQKDLTEQDIKDARDDMNKMQEKLDELTKYRDNFEKELDKMLGTVNIDDYDIKGPITFDIKTGILSKAKVFELAESEEKEELLERPQIEVSNEILLKFQGEDEVFVKNEIFEAYKKNIPELAKERITENTKQVYIDKQAVIDMFSRFIMGGSMSIKAMLTQSVQVTQENLAIRFLRNSYQDLNNFIYYGAMELIGAPEIKISPEKILYDVAQMQAVYIKMGKITYLNAHERVAILDFKGTNFVNRLKRQFQEYIIPIFARFVKVGIDRYDEELSKWLYIAANNKFDPTSVKIKIVPEFGGKQFYTQFGDNLTVLNKYDPVKFDEDEKVFYGRLEEEKINISRVSGFMTSSDRFVKRFKHVYDEMMKMVNQRDAYIDFIKIYEKIYSVVHREQYDKFKENYEKENK